MAGIISLYILNSVNIFCSKLMVISGWHIIKLIGHRFKTLKHFQLKHTVMIIEGAKYGAKAYPSD